jgi:hypothetical protein
MRLSWMLALPLLATSPAVPAGSATLGEITLLRTGYDDAAIELATGERFRLGLRGCQSDLRGYGGRTSLLWCPTAELSAGCRLLLPEFDLDCAIQAVDTLPRAKNARPAIVPPEQGLVAMRQALELLGYDCGPPGSGWGLEAALAFLRFREAKRLDAGEQGTRRAITSLALDVMGGRQASGTGLRLSRIIALQLDALARWLSASGPGGTGCQQPAWIRAVTRNGVLVALSDGTTWQLPVEVAGPASRWNAGEQVTVCAGRMVYWPSGEMVPATLAR